MRYYRYLALITITTWLAGCKNNEVPSMASSCYPGVNPIRSERIINMAVTVQASGGLAAGYQLVASSGVAWSACNLPDKFKHNGLALSVSGYSLTWPQLAFINLSPLPFEVSGAQLR